MLVNENVGCIHPQTSCFTVSYKENVGVNAIFELFFKKTIQLFQRLLTPKIMMAGSGVTRSQEAYL